MVKAYWYIKFFQQIWQGSPAYGGWKASGGDTFRIILMTAGYQPNQDTHAVTTDLQGEVDGQGYTPGGQVLTNKTISTASGSLVLGAADVTWTGCVFDFRWAVIYDDTNGLMAQKQLVRFIDFQQTISLAGETLRLKFDGQGVIVDITPPADTTPPVLETTSSFVNGPLLELAYDEALDTTSVPATTDFVVEVNAVAHTVSSVSINSNKVDLVLSPAVVVNDIVTISYTVPGTNFIRDLAFNAAAALTDIEIDNTTVPEPPDPPPADVTPPVVAITSPTNGATVSDTITVTATATDANGIVSVVLYVDGAAFSTDTTSPYSFDFDTTQIANGAHTLQAKAKDPAGNEGSSAVVNITISNVVVPPPDTTAPSVSITSPVAGAFVTGTITVAATATDNVGVVSATLFVDDVSQGVDAAQPYSFSLDTTLFTDGLHTLHVTAVDAASNTGTSADVQVTIDNSIPVLSTAAINGASLALTYNEALNVASVPLTSAFAVRTDGNLRTLNSVSVSGSQVLITLAVPVLAANVVTVSYTAGATPIENQAGLNAANLTNQAVTNNTPGDLTPPTITGISIGTTILVVQYNELLDTSSVPATSAYSVLVNNVTSAISSLTIDTARVRIVMASPVISTDIVSASYTAPATGKVRDLGQNNAANFTNLPVTNITAPATPTDLASFVSQNVPSSSMQTNTTQNVTVTMRNDGTATWSAAGGYHLYSQNPAGNTNWGFSQVAVPGSVLQNASAVFNFTITAPSTAGTYNFQWRMRHTTTQFGSQSTNVAITVTTSPQPPNLTEIFVRKNGNDGTGTGTSTAPYLTIVKGLSVMDPGDTLTIGAGTYTEGININAIPSGISNSQHTTIRAEAGATVILNGQTTNTGSTTAVMFIYSRSFLTFQDLIFDASTSTGNGVYIGRQTTTNTPSTFIRMIRCTVRNTRFFSGVAAGHNQDGSVDCRFEFIRCIMHSNGLQGASPEGQGLHHNLYLTGQNNLVDGGEYYNARGHGIHCFAHNVSDGNSGVIIRNTKCHDNGSFGIGVYDGTGQKVYNNIVYANGNFVSGSGGFRVGIRSQCEVYNNTITGNTGVGLTISSSGNIARNNIVYNNTGTEIVPGTGNTVDTNIQDPTNPLFVNSGTNNFHLLAGSPAINAGVNLSSVFTIDHDGLTRPSSGAWEIGAYEFTGTQTIYGTYLNPFTPSSPFNLRVQSTAILTPANIVVPINNCHHIFENYVVKTVSRSDPLINVHDKGTFSMCSGGVNSTIWYQIPMPTSYVNTVLKDNGVGCFVEIDSLTAPGRISEGFLFERCTAGGPAAQFGPGPACLGSERNGYTVSSFGITNASNCVGAGGFSNLGGVIRSGELTSAVGVPIPHALRVVMNRKWLNCNPSSSTPGYRWPAKSADQSLGGACHATTGYTGSVPSLVIGSVLTLLPTATESSLGIVTEPGKKIFHAVQDYGAYPVDSFPNSTFNNIGFVVQCETHASQGLTVMNQFFSTYGVDLVGRYGSFHNWTGFELQFHNDLCQIFNNMQVITNTSQSTPKG